MRWQHAIGEEGVVFRRSKRNPGHSREKEKKTAPAKRKATRRSSFSKVNRSVFLIFFSFGVDAC